MAWRNGNHRESKWTLRQRRQGKLDEQARRRLIAALKRELRRLAGWS
jgi:hypothetical protein